MISPQDYWNGRDLTNVDELTPEIRTNADITMAKVSELLDRANAGADHFVTSGWRSRAGNAATPGASATSKHLSGQAVDISDADRYLADWCAANLDVLEEIGLWCEDFRYTPRWVHFQIVPPKSGKRIFIPSMAKPADPDFPVSWI